MLTSVYTYVYVYISILVHDWIKETARVFVLVKPQLTGCITTYTPVVNGYTMQSKIYPGFQLENT